MALPQELRESVRPSPFETEQDCIELSDEELRALVDTQARKFLHISGEEVLQRLRARKPLTDESGNEVPAWGPVSMLARLLLDD
jgi:hypothetical protein